MNITSKLAYSHCIKVE